MKAPWLESWAARIGVAVFVALSAWIGYGYWDDRGEFPLAVATVGAELIAFAGLAIARHNWRASRGVALAGVLVTVLAAIWCGFTTWQKIEADTRSQALADARERPAYVFAARALESTSSALEAQMSRQPPTCTCPDTIRAWEESQTASINRLVLERDTAQARLDVATPAAEMDWIAVIRGAGMEAVKLLGFMVFGLLVPTSSQTVATVSHKSLWWRDLLRQFRVPGLVGATALATAPAYAGEPPENTGALTVSTPDPVVQFPETGARAKAFALRGRKTPTEIAAEVGVSRATVYRWFQKRDLQMRGAA